jgi:hypothetical protein
MEFKRVMYLMFVFIFALQCNPLFIGISRRVLNVRPAAFFFIRCNIESKEIQRLYAGAQDGYESTQLYTVSLVSSNSFFLIDVSIGFFSMNKC